MGSTRQHHGGVHAQLKRTLDIAVSMIGLLVFGALIAAIAIAVRLTMGSPILFKQWRPGLHGKPFLLLKFRTMTVDCDADGCPASDGQRLTRLGRILRSTSLDELPELWNVLKGDMSLVGPRPLLLEYLPLYSPEQARRHEMRPGITGWAQTNGRNGLPWRERLALDVWYVENHSIALDAYILLRTLVTVVRREGISQDGQVTAEKFRGDAQ